MIFKFKIKNKNGAIEEGEKYAKTRLDLAHELHVSGAIVIDITEANSKKVFSLSDLPFFGKVKMHTKILFARNLSGMLKAGLSLPRSLQVFEKQTKNETFQKTIQDLIHVIDAGGTFGAGLEHHPKIFSSLFVSMIRAGEESGKIPDALSEIADNLEKTYTLQKKVKGALMYPMVILIAIFLIGILMMMFVVPTITGTFKELGVPLPITTRIVIGFSDLLAHHTLLFFGILGILFFGGGYILRRKELQPFFSRLILHLPIIGTLVKEINSARTARTMTALLSAGVPITRALEITKEVIESDPYQKVIEEAMLAVEKGAPISEVFKRYPKLYPVMVGEMVEVGEDTGEIAHMLEEVAKYYEEEVDGKTKNLSTIIEPILMIMIGAAVGFFAVSMLTPMYSLLDSIK